VNGLAVLIWERRRNVIGVCMCGGQRSKEDGREIMCMGCKHVVGEKSKNSGQRLEKKGKA
jgi:hypothetical protein